MLTVLKQNLKTSITPIETLKKQYDKKDIIVNRIEEVETETKDGLLKKRNITKVNLTKKINETKKTIKQETATDKITQLENELSKGVL